MSDFSKNPQVYEAIRKFSDLNGNIGRAALSALYPDDFELYLISLELVSVEEGDKESVIRFFSFPVMPNSISYTEQQLNNVKKTMGGITSIGTQSFLPKDIQIQGNFGRNLRLILNNNAVSFNSIDTNMASNAKAAAKWVKDNFLADKSDTLGTDTPQFSTFVKSGYGSIKILEKIIEKSRITDNGRSRKLYLHLPVFGKSYLVKPQSINLNQNMQSNMIWNYNLSFKVVGEIRTLSKKNLSKSLVNKLSVSLVQNGLKKVSNRIQNNVTANQYESVSKKLNKI